MCLDLKMTVVVVAAVVVRSELRDEGDDCEI